MGGHAVPEEETQAPSCNVPKTASVITVHYSVDLKINF